MEKLEKNQVWQVIIAIPVAVLVFIALNEILNTVTENENRQSRIDTKHQILEIFDRQQAERDSLIKVIESFEAE
jgi:hypothetical protein